MRLWVSAAQPSAVQNGPSVPRTKHPSRVPLGRRDSTVARGPDSTTQKPGTMGNHLASL